MRTYRITHTYEIEAERPEQAQAIAEGMARNLRDGIDAAAPDNAMVGLWPTAIAEEIDLDKCRTLHGTDTEVEECWQERAREAPTVAQVIARRLAEQQ